MIAMWGRPPPRPCIWLDERGVQGMVTRNVGAERSGGPGIMKQRWHDVLFAHWEVAAPSIQKFIPDGMQLDTYEGRAFIGVIPFRMSGIRARGLPPIPGTSAFSTLSIYNRIHSFDINFNRTDCRYHRCCIYGES